MNLSIGGLDLLILVSYLLLVILFPALITYLPNLVYG